jgi:hypothetical protein
MLPVTMYVKAAQALENCKHTEPVGHEAAQARFTIGAAHAKIAAAHSMAKNFFMVSELDRRLSR